MDEDGGFTRRGAVGGLIGALALTGMPAIGVAPAGGGAGRPFSWELLKAYALGLAAKPFRGVPRADPRAASVDYDAVGRIQFRPERALWGKAGDDFGVRFFPLSKYAAAPVAVSVVAAGRAAPLALGADAFAATGPAAPVVLPGVSGFRVMTSGGDSDWLAFQGASYFRSSGALDQYGLSARGLAIDTGTPSAEEFPAFTHFWLEHGPGMLTVYALLEGPSVAGAWRFVNRRGARGVVQEVSCVAGLRKAVDRIGFAPLTSMFWYGEGNRPAGSDWRPEIHDSDGLAMFTGAGERIWRPLNNPPRAITSSFADLSPQGFGLLQRDRNFDHYQDDGVFYDRRPSLWVEPVGDWGRGAVTLYEIPTRGETDDNVVAFWTPAGAAKAGARYALDYRLRWLGDDPTALAAAIVSDCWTGTAGRPGQPPIAGAVKIVADFKGPNLAGLTRDSGVTAAVDVSHGKVLHAAAYPVSGQKGRWRLMVDVLPNGTGSAEMRAYLRRGGGALSETLLRQIPA